MRWSEILRRALGGEVTPPFRGGHSSPHQFDRFDSSRIGTGEGAQVYGHGLYFAENPATVQAYRDSTARTNWRLDGQDWGEYYSSELLTPPERAIASQLNRPDSSLDTVANAYESRRRQALAAMESGERLGDQAGMERYIAAQDWLRQLDEQMAALQNLRVRGLERNFQQNSYDVNLHLDPARVLNFNAPVAGQAHQIQEIGRSLGASELDFGHDLYRRALEARMGRPEDYSSEAAYQVVRRRHSPSAAADLRERGIEGWVYPDQGSRGVDSHTFNMVVPPGNEDRIEILRRWGLLGTLGGGSAYEALGGLQ
jgi:hypothetical protein